MTTVPLTAPAPYNGGIRRLCGRLNVIARNCTRELLIRRGFHDIGNRLVHEGEALHTLIIASVKLLLGHALVLVRKILCSQERHTYCGRQRRI